MAQAFKLTVSGAGIASVAVSPSGVRQIAGVLAKAGPTNALNVTLYSCPTQPSGSIPSGSQELGAFLTSVASDSRVLDLSPDGIDVLNYIAAQFTDTDTAHAVYVYVK